MNKRGVDDILADMIPSIILMVIGVLIIYYFSYNYSTEIHDNEFMITMADRESFSTEGMMEHQIDVRGVKYTTIELIEKYYEETKPEEKSNYQELIVGSANDYLAKVNPAIAACFKITLDIPLQKQIQLVDMCEMKYAAVNTVKTEESMIPLQDGGYAKIRIEHGEPLL